MKEYLLLMHGDVFGGDAVEEERGEAWEAYLSKLQQVGAFQGGSAIGGGVCLTKGGTPPGITEQIVGYIRVQAESLERARELVVGNPVFEEGGTVELRELV